jgi:hypothetical protein
MISFPCAVTQARALALRLLSHHHPARADPITWVLAQEYRELNAKSPRRQNMA